MKFSLTHLAFLIGLLLAIALRSYIASNDPLWLDELHTVWATNTDFSEVATRARLGNQQPLYFQVVWITRSVGQLILSDSATALTVRLVSLTAGWLLILGASYLTFVWSGCWQAAICTAWLMALDQEFLFYGTEARPYGLMLLVAVVQVYFFWQWLKLVGFIQINEEVPRDRARITVIYLGLVIASVIAIRLHLTAIWLMVSQILFLLLALLFVLFNYERKKLFDLKFTVGSSVAVLIGSVLLLATLYSDVTHLIQRKENWSIISDSSVIWRELRWVLLGFGVIGLLTLHFNILSKVVDEKSSQNWVGNYERIWQLKFVLLWAIIPLVMVLLFDYTGLAPLAVKRYALVGAVAVPIGIGLLVSLIESRFLRCLLTIIIVIGLGVIEPWFSNWFFGRQLQLRSEDWSSAIQEINQNQNDYPVLLLANLIEDGMAFEELEKKQLEYLEFPLRAFPTIDDRRSIIACPTVQFESLPDRVVQSIGQAGGSWIVIRSSNAMKEEIVDEILTQLASDLSLDVSVEQAKFPSSSWSDVHLLKLTLESDNSR